MSETRRPPDLPADSAGSVRRIAERELAHGRSAWLVNAVLDRVAETAAWERAQVLEGIGQVAGVERILPTLVAALREPDDAARRNAARSVLATLASPGSNVAPQALDALAGAARDTADRDARIMAVTALSDAANPDALPHLAPLLRDAEPNVASAATEAMGATGDAAAVEPLARALDERDEPWIRLGAILALGRLHEPAAVPALGRCLREPRLAAAAVSALREIAAPEALPLLRPLAEDDPGAVGRDARRACAAILAAHPSLEPPDWVRHALADEAEGAAARLHQEPVEAARLLALSGTEAAVDLLLDALDREDIENAAAAALRLLPSERLRGPVLQRVTTPGARHRSTLLAALPALDAADAARLAPLLADPTAEARAAAGDALARSGDDVALPVLLDALPRPERRAAAARALGRLERPPCPALATLLEDADAEVRAAAAEALRDCDASGVKDSVLRALHRERQPAARRAMLGALGATGGTEAVRLLAPALESADTHERFEAARALGQTRDGSALPALVHALADPAPEVQAAALRALGRLGDPRAAEPLLGRLEDTDSDLRRTAAAALQRLAPPAAIARLAAALEDDDWEIRLAAVRTLQQIAPDEHRAAFRRMSASDPDPLVRRAAAAALEGTDDAGGRRTE